MIIAMFVTFFSFLLLVRHVPKPTMRWLVGHKGKCDVLIHGTILWMFLGTSTEGLLQAEAAGILFSLYLRAYSWAYGYDYFKHRVRWSHYGALNQPRTTQHAR